MPLFRCFKSFILSAVIRVSYSFQSALVTFAVNLSTSWFIERLLLYLVTLEKSAERGVLIFWKHCLNRRAKNCYGAKLMAVSSSPKNRLPLIKKTREAMYVHLNIEARSCSHCCSGKAINVRHSECVFVALVTQHAVQCAWALLSSVAGPALHYFSTLSDKRQDFQERKKCYWT